MYGAIWRLLPGDRLTKALAAAILILVVVAVLWYVAFPWIEPKIRFDHGTVEGGGTGTPGSSAPATPPP